MLPYPAPALLAGRTVSDLLTLLLLFVVFGGLGSACARVCMADSRVLRFHLWLGLLPLAQLGMSFKGFEYSGRIGRVALGRKLSFLESEGVVFMDSHSN